MSSTPLRSERRTLVEPILTRPETWLEAKGVQVPPQTNLGTARLALMLDTSVKDRARRVVLDRRESVSLVRIKRDILHTVAPPPVRDRIVAQGENISPRTAGCSVLIASTFMAQGGGHYAVFELFDSLSFFSYHYSEQYG